MKNILIKITFIVLSLTSYFEALSDSKTIYGNLFVTTTTVVTTAAVTVTDCDGNVIRSIPATSNSYSKQSPATNTGQTVRFMVYRKDPSGNTYLYQDNVSINSITYSTSDGSYTHTLNNALLVNSRYNYLVRVYTSTESYATMYEEQEFTISSGSAIMPIGAVISYIGNPSNISGLESGGWFKCDGRAISTLTLNLTAGEITALANIIGSYLPDLRGMFTRGVDEGRGTDDNAGTRINGAIDGATGVGSYQPTEIQSHGHTGTAADAGNHRHTGTTDPGGWSRSTDDGGNTGTAAENSGTHTHSFTTDYDGIHSHTLTIGNTGGAETRPENISVYYLIRCR